MFPIAHARQAVQKLPDARLHVFDGCGHWPHIEHRGEFNRLVLDFLLAREEKRYE